MSVTETVVHNESNVIVFIPTLEIQISKQIEVTTLITKILDKAKHFFRINFYCQVYGARYTVVNHVCCKAIAN